MINEQDLRIRISKLKNLIYILRKRASRFPDGRLRIGIRKGKARYYNYLGEGRDTYLGLNEKGLAVSLAQKGYNEKVIEAAEKEMAFLQKIVKGYPERPEDVYEKLKEARRVLVEPVVLDDTLYARKWIEKPYDQRIIDKDTVTFTTNNGDKVVSKSEKIIADTLHKLGIPYKYDCPLVLNDDGFPVTKYPDFTALNVKKRKEYYVEHLGMMDKQDYIERNLKKIELYERNGIYPGDKLILIHETDARPLDVEVMEKMLAKFLLE